MLDALLADLRAQRYMGNIQIVVIEETDEPRPLCGVDYVPIPVQNLGIAFARNIALANARHDTVVFVDDDCRVGADWLSTLVAPVLRDNTLLGAQGGVTVPLETNAIGWAESLLGFPGGGIARIYQSGGNLQETCEVSTLNAVYRKHAIERVGGFPEEARWGGEDFVLAKRVAAHGRMVFIPNAEVRHAARGSLSAIWWWFVRRGLAEVDLWRAGLAPGGYGSFLLRSSFLLKLAVLFLGTPWLGWWLPLSLPVAVMLMTWWRLKWALEYGGVPRAAFWIAPMVRLVMDMGADLGRIRANLWGTR